MYSLSATARMHRMYNSVIRMRFSEWRKTAHGVICIRYLFYYGRRYECYI